MRLIFIDNLIYEVSYGIRKYDLQPNLGLLSLVAVACEAGHEAEIYDPKWDLVRGQLDFDASLYRDIAHQILKRAPDVVGFTALGCNFHCVANVAAQIKRLRPKMPILLGGPHATILHREILERFPAFDAVVRHEAERTLPAVLDRLDSLDLAGVAGVSFRDRRGDVVCNEGRPIIENLDTLPMPAYDRYPLAELGLDTIRVEAGRGCPFSCTFCSTASFFGRNYRIKTPPRLLQEMDYLHHKYGYADFKLNHDLFTVNRKKVAEFCEAMLDRRYTWRCSARVDCVDADLLSLMSRAGCRDIYFGIETGSERMQAISRKCLDLHLVEPTLDVVAQLGMSTTVSFITGYPEESLEDQTLTLDFAGRLFCRPNRRAVAQLHLLTPEPGTQLMATYGDVLRFDGHVTDFNFPRLQSEDDVLIAADPVIFGNHHYFPTVLPRERHVFVTSIWTLLWIAGPVLLAYLLRSFDGRLSQFMNEAYEWYAGKRPTRWNVDETHLFAFLAARFGYQHHLISLFRYALAASAVLEARRFPATASRARGHADQRDVVLGIAAKAAILRDIHDCGDLAERITSSDQGQIFDDASCGPLGYFLLTCCSEESSGRLGDRLVTYEIDKVTADLLERFAEPKSYWQCCREIAEGEDTARFPDWSDVARLCDMGVLEAHSRRENRAAVDLVLRW